MAYKVLAQLLPWGNKTIRNLIGMATIQIRFEPGTFLIKAISITDTCLVQWYCDLPQI
jgi:hypothetical protein